MNHVLRKPVSVTKAIYTSLTGLSPVIANEICYRAGVDGGMSTAGLSMQEQEDLYAAFDAMRTSIKEEQFAPCIAYQGYAPKEFAACTLTMYGEEVRQPSKEGCGWTESISVDVSGH